MGAYPSTKVVVKELTLDEVIDFLPKDHPAKAEYAKLKERLSSLKETVAIMGDSKMMAAIKKGKADIKAGRVHDLINVVAELDKNFS